MTEAKARGFIHAMNSTQYGEHNHTWQMLDTDEKLQHWVRQAPVRDLEREILEAIPAGRIAVASLEELIRRYNALLVLHAAFGEDGG